MGESPRPVGEPGDERQATVWLELLRDGTAEEKAVARRGLAEIFEARGMLPEAVELLTTNARSGYADAALYRSLARLYQALGDEPQAESARTEADRLAGAAAPVSHGPHEPSHPATPSAPPRNRLWIALGGLLVLAVGAGLIALAAWNGVGESPAPEAADPERRPAAIVEAPEPSPTVVPTPVAPSPTPAVSPTPTAFAPAPAPAGPVGSPPAVATGSPPVVAIAASASPPAVASPDASPTVPPDATATPAPSPTAPEPVAATSTPPAPTTSGRAAPAGGACPSTHPIKGNLAASGERIYHVPGGAFYGRTGPEACFATEADARAAGFRRSQR